MNILPVEVDSKTHLRGNFKATNNVVHKIRGSILGSLTLDKDSFVHLTGTIEGDIANNGGVLHVFGTVIGKIFNNGGQTKIDKNANIIPIDHFILTL